MHLLPDRPDIPVELVAAQERGQVIFVCGAGVSRTAGLPLFLGLVEKVYERLGEDWSLHSAEREREAWRCMLWAAFDKGDAGFQSDLASLMLQMPEASLLSILSSIA